MKTMKLFLLKWRKPDNISYDMTSEQVVIAYNKQQARVLAETNGNDESRQYPGFWNNHHLSTCTEIKLNDEYENERVLLSHIRWG